MNETNTQEHLHFGHLGLVALVAVVLLGMTWLRDPELFSFKQTAAEQASTEAPAYYAYVPDAADVAPVVLGDTTMPEGPSVINEDGSISSVADLGEVLGANTQDIELSMDAIRVRTTPDTSGSVEAYIIASTNLENGMIEAASFEGALTSGNQADINLYADRIFGTLRQLEAMVVPQSAARLHKLKITQLQTAAKLLQDFSRLDDNPEEVSETLTLFIASQQAYAQELRQVTASSF
jgi:hypothetical protein